MVIRIEMLNGEEDGEEKREEKGKFWWGNFGSHLPFFFSPACHVTVFLSLLSQLNLISNQ